MSSICTGERCTYAVNSGTLQMLAHFCDGLPGFFEISNMLLTVVPASVQVGNTLQAIKPT